ncbi:hypothetical protein DFS34DRAFT_652561 [Phlyctochytrium arcticum]|nr:hypothetical protein DFS34DRAFT_652561 [Phlyctochytrium arcticum]
MTSSEQSTSSTPSRIAADHLYRGIPKFVTKGTAEEVSENLQEWLAFARNWLRLARPQGRVELLRNKLDRHAMALVENAQTPEELTSILKEAYAAKGTDCTVLIKLAHLKQKSGIAAYKQEFNELVPQREEALQESVTCGLYLAGLKEELQIPALNEYKQGKVNTLRALQSFVDSYETDKGKSPQATTDILAHYNQHVPRSQCEVCNRDNHKTVNCFYITKAKRVFEEQVSRNGSFQRPGASSSGFSPRSRDAKRQKTDTANMATTKDEEQKDENAHHTFEDSD